MSDSQKRICYFYDPDVGNFHFGMSYVVYIRREPGGKKSRSPSLKFRRCISLKAHT